MIILTSIYFLGVSCVLNTVVNSSDTFSYVMFIKYRKDNDFSLCVSNLRLTEGK